MNSPNFDFREFQEDISEKFHTILESQYFQRDDSVEPPDPLDAELTKEAEQTYQKIKKILNVPEMEKAHPFCFGLRQGNVNECDRQKIDQIYQLGIDRGFIDPEDEENGNPEGCEDGECCDDDALCGGPDDAIHPQDMENPLPQEPAPANSAFTVLYSAIKDGKVKVGEFYSNAVDNPGAQEDCINNLTQVGYGNIRIIGTEQNNLAVNTDVEVMAGNEEPEDLLETDDSEEFEKQETGDTEDETKPAPKENPETENPEEEGPKDEDSKDGDSEEAPTELTSEDKAQLKKDYTQTFRDILVEMAVQKSVEEMTLKEKNTFYGKLAKKWTKNDPSEFMTDEEQEKLDKIVIKVNQDK